MQSLLWQIQERMPRQRRIGLEMELSPKTRLIYRNSGKLFADEKRNSSCFVLGSTLCSTDVAHGRL